MAVINAGFDKFFEEVKDRLYSTYGFTKLERVNYRADLDILYISCRFYLYGEEKEIPYPAHGFMIRRDGHSAVANDAIKVFCACIDGALKKRRRNK